jgi:hypothetical protein
MTVRCRMSKTFSRNDFCIKCVHSFFLKLSEITWFLVEAQFTAV